jgi:hypothetical protein
MTCSLLFVGGCVFVSFGFENQKTHKKKTHNTTTNTQHTSHNNNNKNKQKQESKK